MAISNLNLNVTANTARALADFNKFSRSLDNKFLISGLKLDVVRSALNQINRDFQRAIGEQGLASASSLRAAQNQAALLTQTFKAFSSESALAISQNIGTALNKVAVTAGGTMKDVQKTLAATPFISTRLSEDLRNNLAKGILTFQRDMRRGGLGDNFGGVAQQFLMGRATGMQLVESGGAMETFIGGEIIKRVGGEGRIFDAKERSRILGEIVNDPEIQRQLREMAVRASGYKIILEDLNTKLFNPETGIFGALRKVVDAAGTPTTMFAEVEKLTEQVFGKSGMFAMLIKAIRDVFGGGDPMRPFIDAVQFMTRVFKSITDYFNTTAFRNVVQFVKGIVDRVTEVFTGIYRQIRGGGFSAEEITRTIGEIGESIRGYIRQFGEAIRNKDVSKESSFTGDIIGTLVEEVGKTAVVLIKELFMTMVDKVPEIVAGILPALNKGINGVLTEAFGSAGAAMVKFIAGFVPGPIGAIARASAVGDITGGGGSMGSMLAMGAGSLIGPGALFGAARVGRGLFGGDQARMGLLTGLTRRTNRVEELYNSRMRHLYMPGAQRVPLSGLLGRFLGPRSAFASPVSFPPPGGGGFGGYRFPTDPMMGPSSPYGQITSRTSALAGTIGYDIPSSPLFRSHFGRITPETSMFRPYVLSPSDPRRITAGTTMFQPPTARELFPHIATGRPRTGMYNFPTEGPMQIRQRGMLPSAYDRYRNWRIRDNNDGLWDERLARTPSQSTIDRYNRRFGVRGQMGRFGRGIHGVGMGPSAYDRYRNWRIRDNNDGFWDERLARTPSQSTIDRYNRRFGVRGQMGRFGRGIHGVGMGGGYMMAGSLAAEVAGKAVGGAGGEILSGLGQGAAVGGQIGMILGPKGALAGAAIGAAIGGIAPMIDKGVRDEVGKFVSGMGTSMKALGTGIVTGITELGNGLLSALSSLPKMASGVMQGIYNSLPDPVKKTVGFLNTMWSGVTGFVSRLSLPMNFYSGKDFYGPALALEARMSGRKPMVVNDGEFVIPKDGFGTLAGLVGQNLRATGTAQQTPQSSAQVNVTLNLTTHAITANAEDLANELREPVYRIIRDAWEEANNAKVVSRARGTT